ncbi:MAG: TylF/MycF/NovP-related O-methyltransferase [Vicinamibacterales bacterium]|nr:TylF/MycF/NovP-related O-methyltransferase [Vicinamibacterales bacterium]
MKTRQLNYGESLGHRLTKKILAAVGRVLPPPLWSSVLDRLARWARLVRYLLYRRFWIWSFVTGDGPGRKRAETVMKVMPHSLVGWRGLHVTYDATLDLQRQNLDGAVVECGVAQGGSAALMGLVTAIDPRRRHIWLFDSYEGLPDPTAADFKDGATGTHFRSLPRGSCLGTLEQVTELLFDELGLDRGRITLVKGWFDATLAANRGAVGPIALLRIDADWYESVKCCLDELYDSVVDNGYVILDDYYSCFGAKRAVDEFLSVREIRVELIPDSRGGCYFRKPTRTTVGEPR